MRGGKRERLTNECFIDKARKVHGEKFDYSKVNYFNSHNKVIIICPKHGEWRQAPNGHLSGRGCPTCGKIKGGEARFKYDKQTFISEARKVHGNKFDYSKVNYIDVSTKIIITCLKHGDFEQTPDIHLHSKHACRKCGKVHQYNTEEYISEVKKIHGNKYDYSKVKYTKAYDPITIICPIHGEFITKARYHLRGGGCIKCGIIEAQNKTRKTLTNFIKEAKKIHDNKYDYSKVVYINSKIHVTIICPEHGEWQQAPYNHLSGYGCPTCARSNKLGIDYRSENFINSKKITNEEFIFRAKKTHGNKYDYSLTKFISMKTPVTIICPVHGEFQQHPTNHLVSGCLECGGRKQLTTEGFIKRAYEIYGDKYDYSKVKYVNNRIKVIIICPEHGEFLKSPDKFWMGEGCQKCAGSYIDTDFFIEKAKKIHGNKYDYSEVIFEKAIKKVIIICPIHGKFTQTPNSHLNGNGCPVCLESTGEKAIRVYLETNSIKYNSQKTFPGCKHKKSLHFDFYIPSLNVCIEFDGIQHYKPIERFGGQKGFDSSKLKDNIKNEFCKNNNIVLHRIKYNDNVIEKLNKILKINIK